MERILDPAAQLPTSTWQRQHDEMSKLLRQSIVATTIYSLFCVVTINSVPDQSFILQNSVAKMPFAGIDVSLSGFIAIGAILFIGLIFYNHLLKYNLENLGFSPESNCKPLPYIFNIPSPLCKAVTFVQFYILPIFILGLFAWKAIPKLEGKYLY